MIEDELIGAVNGHCPMGCGYTEPTLDTALALTISGAVVCLAPDCPNPRAVDQILADPETEHVVQIEQFNYSMQHPLCERINRTLLEGCELGGYLSDLAGPPVDPGRYRVVKSAAEDTWAWTLLP